MKYTLIAIAIVFASYYFIANAGSLPKVGDAAPSFSLLDAAGTTHTLADYQGKWLVLYFYPKDGTPGCTKEACHFRDDYSKIEKLGAQIIGISLDDEASHASFSQKYHLPFPLLADKDGKVTQAYGAMMNLGFFKLAKRYTFLISPEGKIAKVYTKVEADKHSEEIIADLQAQLK